MRFFLDNCMSPHLARALDELDQENEFVHLRQKFQADTPDHVWLLELAEEGDWTVIGADVRISKNRVNREAWRRSGVTIFIFKAGYTNLGIWDQAWRTVRWWPFIRDQAALIKRGTGAGFWVPHGKSFGKFEPIR